ncbi:hypothetical protein [Allomuricauda sp. SCSIO 65647]|uniref:hypothetical protein n=1 Tax=Allomuricauda sp. SCSIO 65647 TaxID=2908843 RepID=UPI001F37AFB0|nr:hypothetical protein [Muricauda sp. SCSIO 65647]UJH66134.1 hypothetical protein L0P89_09125 [Muricauda sp. SCSIO 65647]
MKKIITLFLLVMPLIYVQAQEKELSQMQRVMKMHDKLTGKTARLIDQLESRAQNATSTATYTTAINDLKSANKAMTDWMESFSNRFDTDEMHQEKSLTQQKQDWLNEEEAKLLAMKEQIDSSIKRAKDLLVD